MLQKVQDRFLREFFRKGIVPYEPKRESAYRAVLCFGKSAGEFSYLSFRHFLGPVFFVKAFWG